jgi:prefoldin subunit 5
MDRLARIEERRVEAERVTAEALADTGKRLDRLADANEKIAGAITAVARALQQIADNFNR